MERPADHWPEAILRERIVTRETTGRKMTFVNDPSASLRILTDRSGTFVRSRLQNRFFAFSFGDNLLDNRGGRWLEHRRSQSRPIAPHRVVGILPAIEAACRSLIEQWAERVDGEPPHLARDARILSFDALWRGLFAADDEDGRTDPRVLAAGERLHTAHEAGFEHYVGELRTLAQWVIERADAGLSGLPPGIAADPLDPNSTLIFLDAGHDNVAATLTWVLWLLANRPDLQRDIRREWREAGRTALDPARLPLIGASIRETLRLYPPAPQILRDVTAPVEICGQSLARKSLVILPVYAMHRSRLWWRDPDAFWPERFLDGEEGEAPAAAWIPFSKGERGCFGAAFAQADLATFIGMILDRFELEPDPAKPLKCDAHWVLRPVGDSPLRLRRISDGGAALG